jgi:hypothetical protein
MLMQSREVMTVIQGRGKAQLLGPSQWAKEHVAAAHQKQMACRNWRYIPGGGMAGS